MTDTPLNPDALEAAARAANEEGWTCFEGSGEPGNFDTCEDCQRVDKEHANAIVSAYLAVAQPEVDETALANLITWKKLPFMATQFIRLDANAAHKVIELLRPHLSIKPQVVHTIEELEALPVGTILIPLAYDTVAVIVRDQFKTWAVAGHPTPYGTSNILAAMHGKGARVVYMPEANDA